MKPGITFRILWSDDDIVKVQVDSSDGKSTFSTTVYVSYTAVSELITELSEFRKKVHGGIYDIRWGEFGPEFANGAIHARLHFHDPCRMYVSIKAQSDFADFGIKKVASEAILYFTSEPILLDNFIAELKRIKAGANSEAELCGVESY